MTRYLKLIILKMNHLCFCKSVDHIEYKIGLCYPVISKLNFQFWITVYIFNSGGQFFSSNDHSVTICQEGKKCDNDLKI